jgi:hypothetical protein
VTARAEIESLEPEALLFLYAFFAFFANGSDQFVGTGSASAGIANGSGWKFVFLFVGSHGLVFAIFLCHNDILGCAVNKVKMTTGVFAISIGPDILHITDPLRHGV